MTLKRHERQAMRRIGIILASLMIAAAGLVFSAGTASAASCFASHYAGPLQDSPYALYNGHIDCSASVTFTFTSQLTKNGTVVDTDHGTLTRNGVTTSVFVTDPAGVQTWCGKTSVTWSGGSSATGWNCNLF